MLPAARTVDEQKARPWSGVLGSAKWLCLPSRTNGCCILHQTWVSLGDPPACYFMGGGLGSGYCGLVYPSTTLLKVPLCGSSVIPVTLQGLLCCSFCSAAPTFLHTQHRRHSLRAHWLSLSAWLWRPVVAEQTTHYWNLIHQTTAPQSPGNSGYSVATVADISECSVLSWSPAHSHVPADLVLCSLMDPGFMDILHLVPFQLSFLNMGQRL